MSEISLEDRLRATLGRAAGAPVTAAVPVGRVVAGARRRRRRARTVRTALVVAVVLALLGALTVERRNRIGTEPDRIERILENSNTLLPTWLPDGLEFVEATLWTPTEARFETDVVQVVVEGGDPSTEVVIAIGPLEATVRGTEGLMARLPRVDFEGVALSVLYSGGKAYSVFGGLAGADLTASVTGPLDLRALAGIIRTIEVTGDHAVVGALPHGLRVVYNGRKVAASPRSSLVFRDVEKQHFLTLDQGYGLAPFAFTRDPSDESVDLGWAIGVFAKPSDGTESIVVFDDAGREHVLSAYGVDKASLVRIATGLRPVDRSAWHALQGGRKDAVTVERGEVEVADEPTASSALPASTATPGPASVVDGDPRPASDPPPTVVAVADDVPVGGVVATGLSGTRVRRAAVVRVAADRWVGVDTAGGLTGDCTVDAVMDGDRIVRWNSSCADEGPHEPDGRCAVTSCRVGLLTFAVRVEAGRVVADLSKWVLGVPGPMLTGEGS